MISYHIRIYSAHIDLNLLHADLNMPTCADSRYLLSLRAYAQLVQIYICSTWAAQWIASVFCQQQPQVLESFHFFDKEGKKKHNLGNCDNWKMIIYL